MSAILHPTDFSETSRFAFEHALALALSMRGKLVLLHTGRRLGHSADWHKFPHVRETLARWGVIVPDLNQYELSTATGMSVVKIEEKGGDPAAAIEHYCRHNEIDLVVMATHARTGLGGLLRPSATRALAQTSRIPILVLREGMTGFAGEQGNIQIQHTLVPVASEPDPQIALDWVARLESLAGINCGRIEVLHAGNTPLEPPVIAPWPIASRFSSSLIEGAAEKVITAHARSRESGLIVMSRAGPSSLKERWIGSTSEQMMHVAPCPLLLVPEGKYAN